MVEELRERKVMWLKVEEWKRRNSTVDMNKVWEMATGGRDQIKGIGVIGLKERRWLEMARWESRNNTVDRKKGKEIARGGGEKKEGNRSEQE